MSTSHATPQDAELILKLYDFRREQVMREARKFFFTLKLESLDDLMGVAMDFTSKDNAYFRQVIGYWDMAASLVLHGALNKELALDNFTEGMVVYAKLQPFVAEFRKRTGMEMFAANIEKFVESSPEAKERIAWFQKRFAQMREQMAAHAR